MFFETYAECCDEFYSGRKCQVYDDCDELSTPVDSYDGSSPNDGGDDVGDDKESEEEKEEEMECHGWHVVSVWMCDQ